MATTYKSLSDEDLKIEKDSLKAFEKKLESKGLAGSNFGSGFKTIIILGFFLSLASVIGAGYLYKAINKEKRQREALEVSQLQIRDKASSIEQDTEKSKTEIQKLRKQIQTYAVQRTQFERKLEDSRKEVSELRVKLKEIEEKTAAINKAADKIQTDLNLPASSLAAAGAGVKTGTPAVQNTAKFFQVLTVNRKFNFVVLNLGLKDNSKIGDTLQVQRDGKNVAQVSIEKIYDNFSAATIVKESKDAPIKEGDRISKA